MDKEGGKILLAVNSDIGRGNSIGFRFAKIAEELERKGVSFQIIGRADYSKFKAQTPFYKNYLARILNGIRIYFLPFLNYRNLDIRLFDRFCLKKIKKMEKGGDIFRVVHFGEPLVKSMAYLKNKKVKIFLDIPIAHRQYALYLRKRNFQLDSSNVEKDRFTDRGIELADVLVIPSLFVKESLKMAGWGEKKMELVNFGADLPDDFGEEDIEKRIKDFQEKKTPLRFIFSGAVNFRKGINFLLSAWDEANLKNAELLICGRIYKKMRREIKKYKNSGVKFLGFTPAKPLMRQSHVFVFPSLAEGSAKAVFEALSFGLPAATTFNAGSVVEDKKDGYIIPIGDSEILAQKLKYFYDNPKEILKMGINSFQKSKGYTWEKYSRKVVGLYI